MAELEFGSQTVKPKGHEHNKCKGVGVSTENVSWEASSSFLPFLSCPPPPPLLSLSPPVSQSSLPFLCFFSLWLFALFCLFVCFYFFLFSTGQLETLLPLKNCYHHPCKICGCLVVTQSLVCSMHQFLTILVQGKFLVS